MFERWHVLVACLAVSAALEATSIVYRPDKTDNFAICVELQSGDELWCYRPASGVLSDARFAIHGAQLAMYPHWQGDDLSECVWLDAATGGPSADEPPQQGRAPLAKSTAPLPRPAVELANGWRLLEPRWFFGKGLDFTAPGSDRVVWRLAPESDIAFFAVWKDLVLYCVDASPGTCEGILRCHAAGSDSPLWSLSLLELGPGTHGAYVVNVEGNVFVYSGARVLQVDPRSGSVLRALDLRRDLSITAEKLSKPYLTGSGDELLISSENFVIAYDLRWQRYRWYLETDTFPHTPMPCIHKGRVYLTAGANRKLHRIAHWSDHVELALWCIVSVAAVGLAAALYRGRKRRR